MSLRFRELLQKLLEEHEGEIAEIRRRIAISPETERPASKQGALSCRSASKLNASLQDVPRHNQVCFDEVAHLSSFASAMDKYDCDIQQNSSSPSEFDAYSSGNGEKARERDAFENSSEVVLLDTGVDVDFGERLRQASDAQREATQDQMDIAQNGFGEEIVDASRPHLPHAINSLHAAPDVPSTYDPERPKQEEPNISENRSPKQKMRLSQLSQSNSMLSMNSVEAPVIEINEAWLVPVSRGTSRRTDSNIEDDSPDAAMSERPIWGRRTVVDVARQRHLPDSRQTQDCWLLRKCISSPSSAKRLCWDVLGLIFLAYDMVMVPMQLFELDFDDFLRIMNILTCSFWTVDLLSSFFVGYYTSHKVELRFRLIAMHYLKTWFLLDFMLVVMDWTFFLAGGFSTNARLMRVGKVARGMRVFRLLRMLKFHVVFEDIMDRIHSEYHRTLLGILKLLILIVAVNHFVACIWYGLHNARDDMTWVKAFFTDHDGLGYRYWTAMHWSLTQFTPASMEVVPKNSLERFFAVCTLLVAMVTFSSFVSTITNATTQLRKLNAEESSMYAKLHKFFSEHNVSDELVHTILRFLKTHKASSKRDARSMPEQDVALLKVLPEELKTELRLEVHMPTVRIHPLLYNYELVDPLAVQHVVRVAITERPMGAGEEHLANSQEIKHMVVVKKGQLDYCYSLRSTTVHFKIVAGQWACEAALWAKSPEAFAPLVTKAPSVLILMESSKFISVVKRYENSFKYVKRYAKLFVEYMNEEVKECQWVGILCNNFDSIRDVVQRAFEDASHHEPSPKKGGRTLTRSYTTNTLTLKSDTKKDAQRFTWGKSSRDDLP